MSPAKESNSSANTFYKPFFQSLLIFLCTLIILAFATLFASTVFVNKRTEQYMQNLIYKSNQHHYTAIKSTIQRALSNRYISDQNQEFVVNYFRKIDYKEIYCMYIQLDSVEHMLLTSSYEQIAKHMQNIKFIVENKLSTFGTCVVLDFNFDSIGIILGSKDIMQDNDILSKLDNARDIIKERFNLTVTVTITEPITTATDIFYTLLQLDNLKNYRFITGYNATINDTFEDVALPDVSYPSDIEKRISTSLIKGEKEEFENYMHEFYKYASKTTYHNAKEMVSKLVFTLSKHSAYSNQSTLLSDALKYDILENSINFIKDHFTAAISAPHDTSHVSNNTFTQDVNEIFEREYKNPDFNLAYLANELDISVVYAGQKFKKLFEKSFNTYL